MTISQEFIRTLWDLSTSCKIPRMPFADVPVIITENLLCNSIFLSINLILLLFMLMNE